MVESIFMDNSSQPQVNRPLGVFASIIAGFDRVAANPSLLLPPILLDLFLWFGPRIVSPRLFESYADMLVMPAGTDQALIEAMTAAVEEFGRRLNVLVALNSFPVGVPSLMASRLPLLNPLGSSLTYVVNEPGAVVLVALCALVVGLAFGVIFHRLVARQMAPDRRLASFGAAWTRVLLLTAFIYIGGLLLVTGVLMVASLLSLLAPVLGATILFLSFSAVVWLVIYMLFTPHAIILYRFGLKKAILESIRTVRFNLMSTFSFVVITLMITWLTNQVWMLPDEASWYGILALGGHAFVCATMLAASYAFFQDRRVWAQRASAILAARRNAYQQAADSDQNLADRYEGE